MAKSAEAAAPASPADSLEIRPAEPGQDAARDELVRRHPRGSFFHLAGWRDVVCRVHGHRPRDLYAWRGAELVGVLPLVGCRRPFGGRNLVSVPYGVYGGPLGADAEVERRLAEAARDLAEDLSVGRLELRYRWDPGDDWPRSELYATFVRDLPEEVDQVLARMPKKARAEARKARNKHGLELSEGIWYADDLYRLFLANKHALGSPALPRRHFEGLVERFGREVFVHIVRHERRPVAAVMSFAFEGTLIAYYSGTAPGADRRLGASNFMYMALQEWGVARGFRRFDFCRSRTDSGAYRFKVHQGFEPELLQYRYHLVRDRGLPAFTPSNPRTAVLRRAWTRLPEWIVRRASERLSVYLP